MKTSLQCLRFTLAASAFALLAVVPDVRANGTAYYLDPNGGATAGFDVGSGTYDQLGVEWISSSTGSGTDVAFPTASPYYQMTFGNGGTTTPDLSGTFTVTIDATRFHGIAINSPSINVTFAGSGNDYNSTTGDSWLVVGGSSLTMDDTRQGFDAGGKVLGLNWNKTAITFLGAGTINFETPLGCNGTTFLQTENMTNGTINFQMANTALSGAGSYNGGFMLQAGTLNFASAGSANQFYGFTPGSYFSISNSTTIDNTSGSEIVLNWAGGGGIVIGGNFTFTGTSSLDLGTAPVTLNGSRAITNVANTLAIGGVISGSGFGLTTSGNGTLLLYGANTYTGPTFVNQGTLALTNAGSVAASSQIAVSNATFDVSGLASGTTALTAYSPTNSTLNVAEVSTTVTNVMATTLNPGGPTNIVNILSLPLVTSYPQTFHIVKGITVNGTLNFGLGTVPSTSPAITGYITNRAASGVVDLVVTGGPAPVRLLTWTGTDPSNPTYWDVLTSVNWLDTGNGNIAANFNQLDAVTFNDTATGSTTVNLTTTLTPGSLTVSNNALTYVFTGYGPLSDGVGSLTLNKQGAGTLLLQENGDNFSGNIAANGGTVIIDNNSANITGGTIIGASGTVQVGNNDMAGVLPAGPVTANGALVFNQQDNINVPNTIVGTGTVSQVNADIVTLSGAGSSGNWAVLVTNGTLQASVNTALGSLPGGAVTVTNGGTFDLGGNGGANNANFGTKPFYISGTGVGGNGVIINSSSVSQEDAFESLTLTANSTVAGPSRWDMRNGTPELNLNGFTLTATNASTIGLVAVNVTPGNIIIQQGCTLSFQLGCSVTNSGTITVAGGSSLGLYESSLGSITRNVVLAGGGVINQSAAGEVAYLDSPILMEAGSALGTSAAGITTVYNGVISDGGNGLGLTCTGAGTNVLSATNTYTGPTVVSLGVLALTGGGSIAGSSSILATNTAGFNFSGLTRPFSGTNFLVLGDDINGQGFLNLGSALITNLNYLSISNGVLSVAVANTAIPCITVTNLNLGDGGVSSTINIAALPLIVSVTQFPLIKYATVSGTYASLSLGNMPAGYSGALVNNTGNHSIDLQITSLPSGIWNGGDSVNGNNNWSDSVNWDGTALTGNDTLVFIGTAGLNNTNDTTETAVSVNFLAGAGAFILNGNTLNITAGMTNASSSTQTVDLPLVIGGGNTNVILNGLSAPLIIGGGVTNNFNLTVLTLAGTGTLTNILGSAAGTDTNTISLAATNANWTLVDNALSTPMTAPEQFDILAGTFSFGNAGSAPNLTSTTVNGAPQDQRLGNTVGIATFNMNNGTFTTSARLNTALVTGSTGVLNQVGGTINLGVQFQGANGSTSNALSIVNLSGGVFNDGGTNALTSQGPFYVASRDGGALNLSGGTLNCGYVDISRNANGNSRGSVGVVNLNSGTIAAGRIGSAVANSQPGPATTGYNPSATFNFNGGTLLVNTNTSATNFFQGSVAAPAIPITTIVKAGGAIINDGGYTGIFVLEPLQHDSTLGSAGDGGLTKQGSGSLVLSNTASTYNGSTVVQAGSLALAGTATIAASTNLVIDTGATLDVSGRANTTLSLGSGQALQTATNGTVNGILSAGTGSTIFPGGAGVIGVLNVSSNVTLQGAISMDLNRSASPSSDVVNLTGTGAGITYGGTLNVTSLAGTLALNDSFKLFNATSYGGTFAATNLPALSAGLVWNWNPVNGTLSVVNPVNTSPTNITTSFNGTTLTLSWPADHTGWRLLVQTNSLSVGLNPATNAWFTVTGSAGVDSEPVTINPTNGTVFYRLVYP